jgi:hypothetical protein
MNASLSVPTGCGYYVTPAGHAAITEQSSCACVIKIRGGMIECPDCGTVYGLLRQFALASNGRLSGGKD